MRGSSSFISSNENDNPPSSSSSGDLKNVFPSKCLICKEDCAAAIDTDEEEVSKQSADNEPKKKRKGLFSGGLRESREITLENAKRSISKLCQQLRLNQHCLDTAFNFYKMALSRHLTRGRKHSHIVAACLYITCRIEGTPHLLIDFSDVLNICAFELGRTYLKLSQALCINVPTLDPCLYVLRFANKLCLGDKTHEVTMTALRVVQRMKKDSMHYGRRPSGICGAALLMASRLHQFNRTVGDIIKVVQVHETTLRKRLVEFGETPSSSLTLQEFMTVDLEEEQDPPSYKAARLKDRERLKMLEDTENVKQLTKFQYEIEKHIFEKKNKKSTLNDIETTNDEEGDLKNFVSSATVDLLEELEDEDEIAFGDDTSTGLGPSSAVMGLTEEEPVRDTKEFTYEGDGELDLEGIDDKELDNYIMSDVETQRKDKIWTERNADYLQKQKEKEERLKKELEEGKQPPEKKRKRNPSKKKNSTPANSAGEAIEKMLQEKKISTKIDYDVLRSLNFKMKENPMNVETDIALKAEIVPKEEVLSGLEKKPNLNEDEKVVKEVPEEPQVTENNKHHGSFSDSNSRSKKSSDISEIAHTLIQQPLPENSKVCDDSKVIKLQTYSKGTKRLERKIAINENCSSTIISAEGREKGQRGIRLAEEQREVWEQKRQKSERERQELEQERLVSEKQRKALECLRRQLEQQRQKWERQKQEFDWQRQQWLHQRKEWELKRQVWEQQRQKLDQQRQIWEQQMEEWEQQEIERLKLASERSSLARSGSVTNKSSKAA